MADAEEFDEFEVDGQKFRLLPLKVEVSEALSGPLIELLSPLLVGAAGGKSLQSMMTALKGLSGSVTQLAVFRAAFAKRCKYEKNGSWVELPLFLDDVFQRRHKRYYDWVRKCIELEYGAFLAEIGQNLTEAMAKGSPSDFLTGSLGGSGESSPTSESPTA